MAAIFCLFSVTLCKLANQDISNDLSINKDNNQDLTMPLSAQIITVPRVYISPCPESFRYTFNGKEWFGLLVIAKPTRGIPSRTKVLLSVGIHLKSRYAGEITLAKDKQNAINDIVNGLPIIYRIRFPLQNPIPKLTAIYYNDQLICTGPKDVGQYVTTITLDHTLYTGIANRPQRPFVASTTVPSYEWHKHEETTQPPIWFNSRPTRPPVAQTRPPAQTPPPVQATANSNPDRFAESEFECGNPDYQAPTATGLIVGGRVANRGQFPWLAAYYHNGRGDSGFICGGSLISSKLIVTAAHCVWSKKDPSKRKAEEASFYIGKFNLDTLNGEQNYMVSGVKQFIIHPEWNYNDDRYDADIAIVVLVRTVSFSKFIKPICLWTSTSSYEDLVGKSGVVAGWGKTEFSAISTEKPKWTEVSVVSESTCLRSNNAFNMLTSERTFCAGDKTGQNGPCNGGGFVIKNGGKWYLRGVVSAALLNPTLQTCDTKNYAVFTDATKYTSWLQGNIQIYG